MSECENTSQKRWKTQGKFNDIPSKLTKKALNSAYCSNVFGYAFLDVEKASKTNGKHWFFEVRKHLPETLGKQIPIW